VEKESEIDPDFMPPDIIIRITAGVQTDQFESLAKIKTDCFCIAGLSLQDNRPTFLLNRDFFCFKDFSFQFVPSQILVAHIFPFFLSSLYTLALLCGVLHQASSGFAS
jgi:hypothetical protein